ALGHVLPGVALVVLLRGAGAGGARSRGAVVLALHRDTEAFLLVHVLRGGRRGGRDERNTQCEGECGGGIEDFHCGLLKWLVGMSHTAGSPARADSYRREEKFSSRLQCGRRDADGPMRHEENCMSRADGSAPETLAEQSMRAALRRDMLRFARLQLRDAGLAEDAVQEAIAG